MAEVGIDSKMMMGLVLMSAAGILLIASIFLVPDAVCMAGLLFLVLLLVGGLLFVSAGFDSLKEWRRGSKDLQVKQAGLLFIFFVVLFLVKIFIPESRESYVTVLLMVVWVAIIAIVNYRHRKQS